MPTGYIITESIRPGSRLDGFPLTITAIKRYEVAQPAEGQPPVWTMVEFEFPETEAERLAAAWADVLDEQGWYTDFEFDGEKFVIFPGRIMRYRLGDEAARAEAEAYGRALGIPDAQLDW